MRQFAGRGAAKIRRGLSVGLLAAVVAAHAVLVQNRLDFAVPTESAHGTVPRLDTRWLPPQGAKPPRGRGGVGLLMATDAGDHLARHGRKPTSHQLQRLAFAVQRLDRDRGVGRHDKEGRAIGRHGHGAQDPPHVPRAVHADVVLDARRAEIAEVIGEKSEFPDRAARYPSQPFADIDVAQVDGRFPGFEADPVGNHRRTPRLPQGHGLQQQPALFLAQQEHVVEHVHQVDPPLRTGRRLARDDKVLVAQGIRVQELRPGFVDQVIDQDRFDLLAPPPNALHGPFRLAPAPGHVEQDQLSGPGRPMMACHDARELRGVRGNRLGIEDAIRPEAAAAVVGLLPRAVGIHGEQPRAERVGDVRVFPARVEHAPVAEHRGIEVVVLVEA